MADRPPLSVVVPTRDRPDHLRRALAALRMALTDDDELIVVDSASRGPATRAVAEDAGARTITAARPGTSLARNLGWQRASHEHVAFVDDDVRVTPGWADAIVAGFASSGIAFVAGRVEVPPDAERVERAVAVTDAASPSRIDRSTTGAWGAGCNVAFRRSALAAHDGFDERLGPGTWFASAEDLELFDRVLATGSLGRHAVDALGFHEQWRGRRELVALDWGYGKGMGARLVRLWRLDPPRMRRVVREVVWEGGVRTAIRDAGRGYAFGATTVTVRTVATALGALVWAVVALRPRR